MTAALAALDLPGDARSRGRAHGAALGPSIRAHLDAWLGALAAAGLGEPRAYVADLLADTGFVPAIRAHAPDLLAETEGIAEGAGLAAEMVFALQLIDEEWAYRARRRADAGRLEKCSSVAVVSPGGPTWIGQNMDLGGYTDGCQALLRIEGDGRAPAALVFTLAGVIGLMGVNAAGLAVCVNSLPQLPSAPTGLPVAFMLRRLLQATSLAEASALVLGLPHATNQHYVIAEPGAVRAFEAGAQGVTEYRPADPSRVLHTNHPLSDAPAADEPAAARANSAARLASLTARLARGDPGLAEIQAALSAFDDPAHPVCRLRPQGAGLINFTTGSMVSALPGEGGPVESWVSVGPPSLGGYTRFVLERG